VYVKPYQSKSVFDQNRAYVALGFDLKPSLRLEVGYMNQVILVRSGSRLEHNHTIMVSLFSNARLFRRLRLASADEERNRIARDLHDHIGSSLAYLGFEIDRSIAAAARGERVEDALRDVRQLVTSMVGEIRETLYDLRADVSEALDLASTLQQFIERVRGRSGLDITYHRNQLVHKHGRRRGYFYRRDKQNPNISGP
jgi:signal transduction histidine kinase